jgi:hypothetical protein
MYLEGCGITSILVPVTVKISLALTDVSQIITSGGNTVFLVHAAQSAFTAQIIAHAGPAYGTAEAGAQLGAIGCCRAVVRSGAGDIGYTGIAYSVTIIIDTGVFRSPYVANRTIARTWNMAVQYGALGMTAGTACGVNRSIAGNIIATGSPGIPAVAQHTVCGIVSQTQLGKMKAVNVRCLVTGKAV